MQYSNLEKLGLKISKLGFGAMRFPQCDDKTIDQAQVDKMIDLAMEFGVNYYDTAAVYGDGASEIAMGNSLKKYDRSMFYVADKLPFWVPKTAQELEEVFVRSLKNLQMDYIDFYLMHNMTVETTASMEKLGGLEIAKRLRAEGKIKYLGFSIHDDINHLNKVLDMFDWDFVQIQYNYFDTDGEPGQAGYQELVRRGIPIIIMEPLKGGMLTNLPAEVIQPFTALGGSPASFAFRWLIPQDGIKVILSGMSNVEQTEENLKIFDDPQPLSLREEVAVATVKANITARQKVGCTGCGYCLPCPFGVKIPTHFKSWNMGAMTATNNYISESEEDIANARLCTQCGACMTHCPQRIEIPTKLSELVLEFEEATKKDL